MTFLSFHFYKSNGGGLAMAEEKKRRVFYCKICGKTFDTYRGFRIHQSVTGHKLPIDKVYIKEIEVVMHSDDYNTAVFLKIEPKTTDVASCIRYSMDVLKKAMKEVGIDED